MGDWERALTELVAARGSALKRHAFLLCGSSAEADDLVQEALVRAFIRPPHGDTERMEGYLRKVILNLFLDSSRRRSRWIRLAGRADAQPRSAEAPESEVARKHDVRSALMALSPRQRACVVLKYYEDLPISVIAQELHCSEGQPRSTCTKPALDLLSSWPTTTWRRPVTDVDDKIRESLGGLAEAAGPPGFSMPQVVRRVRRRRRFTASGIATAAVLASVGAVVLVSSFGLPFGGSGESRSPVVPAKSFPAEPPTPSRDASTGAYVCGQAFRVAGTAAPARNGLQLAISSVQRISPERGPQIMVTFSGQRAIDAVSTQPSDIAVLYLKDGIIVGGGPMLNMPGDYSPQGNDLMPYPLSVSPGHPAKQTLEPRDTLCPRVTWQQIWADPASYQVVVLLPQPVETGTGAGAGHAGSGVELLEARASLSQS